MMRFLGYVCLLALAAGAWGWYAGWFSFESSEREGTTRFTIDVHKDEFARDLESYEEKVHEAVRAIDRQIAELRSRSRSANAKARPELEQQIEALEDKKDAASQSLRELQNAAPEELPARKKRVDEVLKDDAPPPPEDADGGRR